MMEEVSDDTNGESTFEFIENKNGDAPKETTTLDETKQAEPAGTQAVATTTVPSDQSSVLYPESLSQGGQTSIPFYNPTNAPSYFTSLPSNPLMQPLPQSVAPGPFAETTNWNPYPTSTASASEAPMTILDPNAAQCSIALPGSETISNPMLPEVSKDGGGGSGVWGWIKGNQLLNKVAEKAKSSVDSVITTLDPGMKEIINSGGDICVIVASENEAKVSAIREAFQLVFGKATVQGVAVQSNSIAPQPVGFSAGLRAAEERISNLRQQGYLDGRHIAAAVENFITELTPDNWFDIGCILLQDSNSGISLQVYTGAIPISSLYVAQAKDQTPVDYPLGWSGHAVTVGQIIASALGVHHSEWHQALTGVSRREILFVAAKSIAGLYKAQLRK